MKAIHLLRTSKTNRYLAAIFCGVASVTLLPSIAYAQQTTPPATTTTTAPEVTPPTTPAAPETPPISADQLDALVAPIAMYPDKVLAQTLAAATYPLEVIQLQQWMERNKQLKDKALADAALKQPWDPVVQAMVTVPEVVKRMAGNIQWTTELGNAFLAQQTDVMDAIQRMRGKAQAKGNLNSSKEQKVETKAAGTKQVIVIEQANPQVVYVPSYDPAVVYGPSTYPYYPYSYPGYYPGMALAWGAGVAIGAGIANNWWGNCNWNGGGDININNNNTFNQNNISNRQGGGNNSFQHQPQHRGNTPYSNRKTSDKYGGNRQTNRPSDRATNRPSTQASDRSTNRPSDRTSADRPSDRSSANRPSDRSSANRPSDRSSANRPSASTRPSTTFSSPDRASNRSMSSGMDRSSAFSSSGGFNRSSASASSMRGGGSMRSSGGFSGGGSRGGGSRGGGRRR